MPIRSYRFGTLAASRAAPRPSQFESAAIWVQWRAGRTLNMLSMSRLPWPSLALRWLRLGTRALKVASPWRAFAQAFAHQS